MAIKKKKSKFKISYGILILVILIGVGVFVKFHYFNKMNQNLAITSGSHQITATTSTPTSPQLPSQTALNPGGAIDKNGQISDTLPPSSDWVSSASGRITLQQPSPNTSIKTNDTISGKASVSSVEFILTDNSVGLIDRGSLKVVNGKFSGQMVFASHSSSGKLEVYYPNPVNGAEEDIVEIDVNFNN